MTTGKKQLTAIILAAGEGTRMKSRLPKVLHTVSGKSLLAWVLQAAGQAGVTHPVTVLGHGADQVAQTLSRDVTKVVQKQRLGTGHAVRCAETKLKKITGEVLVLCGDAPLIRPQTLKQLVKIHRQLKAGATVLTAKVDNPHGYGRIIRDLNDSRLVARIVEERDASMQERMIQEINSGAYCFSLSVLWKMLRRVTNKNQKGEYYLTDIVALLRAAGMKVAAVCSDDHREVLGVNNRQDLAQAGEILNRRTLQVLMASGVTIVDPASTWVEPQVVIGQDTRLLPGTIITGKTTIGARNHLGPNTQIDATRTGEDVEISHSVIESAWIGDRVDVGPFSHIRQGTRLEADVHIGNFAEINRSHLKPGVKMGHVSYLGDAIVGSRANIGAGTITANYDGKQKHPTIIGESAFIGSGSVLVAPCTIGRRALTGAGAVVMRGTDIPPEMVAVGVPARIIKKRS